MQRLSAALLACSILSTALPALAQEQLTLGVGSFDVQDKHAKWMGQVEYRGNSLWRNLRPDAGILLTEKGSQYYYIGLGYDFQLDAGNHWLLTPTFAPGYYEDAGGKNLGGHLEFRSGLEAAYQFDDAQRVGIAFHHMSNASIYEHNPGVETLVVQYTLPLTVFGAY